MDRRGDGSSAATLTLVARDALGNLAPGQMVTPGSPTASIVMTGPAATDGNGVWLGSAKSTVAESDLPTCTAASHTNR